MKEDDDDDQKHQNLSLSVSVHYSDLESTLDFPSSMTCLKLELHLKIPLVSNELTHRKTP